MVWLAVEALSSREPGSGVCGFWRSGFGKFGRVDGYVRLNLRRCVDGLAVEPAQRPLKRHLGTGDVAIIVIVNLRGRKADFGIGIAHLPYQQPGLAIEI